MGNSSNLNSSYKDEISVDSVDRPTLLWENAKRNPVFALSDEDDKARKDKATATWKDKAALDERETYLCDEFWEDFVLMAKVCLLRNSDADLYDVFETIRVKFLGGWGYTESFTSKLDAEIALEEAKRFA